ncbi:RES domain-containing protein [Microvirga rosea]|uniref:RES domain-containing protein n=1 Tax=Microvirga rosea TaxID=2715425 RepID=UPI001D09A676|nr:RES domain-containing protein [Microvirga rosea]MCB8822893.1 RES domain-containing protein [Microvirga rosea]
MAEGSTYYTAEQVETAITELAFHRLLFFAEAPEMRIPQGFAEYTPLSVSIATDSMIDITGNVDTALAHFSDYRATQAFADAARAAGASGIRAKSVRCPKRGATLTWLICAGFDHPEPRARQSWHIRVTQFGVQALCESPRAAIQFESDVFAADPRVANFSWNRAP